MGKVRTLPLTFLKGGSKTNLSLKNRFLYISVIDETSDIKFGIQLGFVKYHHQIPLTEKVGVALRYIIARKTSKIFIKCRQILFPFLKRQDRISYIL